MYCIQGQERAQPTKMELMGIKVHTAGDNFAPIYCQGGVEEMFVMENKMTGRQGIKADSPSLATQIVFNLLITVNYEQKCWLYAVALGSFWIHSTVAMSWTPFAVNGSAKGNSNTTGDGRGGKRENIDRSTSTRSYRPRPQGLKLQFQPGRIIKEGPWIFEPETGCCLANKMRVTHMPALTCTTIISAGTMAWSSTPQGPRPDASVSRQCGSKIVLRCHLTGDPTIAHHHGGLHTRIPILVYWPRPCNDPLLCGIKAASPSINGYTCYTC
ncbi:hypothetical protein ARMGADRAFT_1136600 [Armillaria gallica]|uniref:Uncharacterized protein n=1 Tax=Armillaria gallica TaxID=47427 RepID=A0A2H3CLD2_ARMGA|nr:hypothetical protein ARMGADRAFT_1136600 [Armillaria gallica]